MLLPLSLLALHFFVHIVLHGFLLERVLLLAIDGLKIIAVPDGFEVSLVDSRRLPDSLVSLYFGFHLVFA